MLDCKGLLDALSAYLDGDVDEELRLEIEEHLKSCLKAQAMLHTFEQTIVLHRSVVSGGGGGVPVEVRIRLHEAVRKCIEGED